MDKIPHQSRLVINGVTYKVNPDSTQDKADSHMRHQLLYFDGVSEEDAVEKMDNFISKVIELWKASR